MGKIKHRIIVFLTGALALIVFFEIVLRLVGLVYANLSESDQTVSGVYQESKTVLCIGDSVTFGIGAPRELSYPAQLQRMLNDSDRASNYIVLNRGRPGQNSAQLLTRLAGYLDEFHPDIVTILVGAQNKANFFGYQEYLKTLHEQKRSFFLRLHDSLDRIRVYKFFRLLFRGNVRTVKPVVHADDKHINRVLDIEDSPGEHTQEFVLYAGNMKSADYTPECAIGMQYKLKGEYDKALESLLSVVGKKDVESECYYVVGSIFKERKEFKKAISWFKKGIEQDPTQFINYEGIGNSYRDQNEFKKAIVWFKNGFKYARHETLHKLCYVGINVAFEDTDNIKGGVEFFSKEVMRKSSGDEYLKTLASDYLFMFKKNSIDKEVYSWIENDIVQIVELCNHYNARVILQNYPEEPMVNSIFKKVAKMHNITFVDHEVTFEKYTQGDLLSADYFVPDGHPNAQGYRLMAKNILMALEK